jgi:Na+-driven multidrug efflux pump
MLPVMQIFGEQIISIFVDDQEVIALGAKGLRITSVFYFALGSIYVSRGILNGIGDAAFAFINGFVEMVGRILLPALLAGSLFGVWGLWLSGGLTWFISGLFAVIRYRDKLCRKENKGTVSKLHNSLQKETA